MLLQGMIMLSQLSTHRHGEPLVVSISHVFACAATECNVLLSSAEGTKQKDKNRTYIRFLRDQKGLNCAEGQAQTACCSGHGRFLRLFCEDPIIWRAQVSNHRWMEATRRAQSRKMCFWGCLLRFRIFSQKGQRGPANQRTLPHFSLLLKRPD